jgi:TRAP-type C4-dicarboxylate transport system substrate-binding protein
MLAGACLLLFPAALQAQTVWDMPTEYPENAMPGVGLTAFTKHVAESSAGKLEIRPSFDAKAGIKSAGMLAAIAEGRVPAGDAFAGALEAEDPIFALPSLPFLVTSTADAKRLADIARPHLAAALQKKGLRLLYLTPWPPSGIWSKTPLTSLTLSAPKTRIGIRMPARRRSTPSSMSATASIVAPARSSAAPTGRAPCP